LPKTVDRFNRFQVQEIANLIENTTKGPVAVLGMPYKPGTLITEESFGRLLLRELKDRRIDASEFISDYTSVVVLALPGVLIIPEFIQKRIVIDCWRAYPELKDIANKYISLGQCVV